MNHTIFDDIVSGNMKSWKVWEDQKFLAFLNTVSKYSRIHCGDTKTKPR